MRVLSVRCTRRPMVGAVVRDQSTHPPHVSVPADLELQPDYRDRLS